jgi:hypothetical protein
MKRSLIVGVVFAASVGLSHLAQAQIYPPPPPEQLPRRVEPTPQIPATLPADAHLARIKRCTQPAMDFGSSPGGLRISPPCP